MKTLSKNHFKNVGSNMRTLLKTNLLTLTACFLFSAGLYSCSDSDDVLTDGVIVNSINVPDEVETLFVANFPNAQNVEWKQKHNLYEANFSMENIRQSAWFEYDGTWKITRKSQNLGGGSNQLPQPIIDYIQSNYAGWAIDDIDLIVTLTDTFYEIELQKRGEPEVTIFIKADGTLLNTIVDRDFNDGDVATQNVPEAVLRTFYNLYPKAIHIEWERENGMYEAEFILDNKGYDALFQEDGTWIRTETEINLRVTPLPQPVIQYIDANYTTWTIDEVSLIDSPQGEYYRIELEKKGQPDVELFIRPDGTVMTA